MTIEYAVLSTLSLEHAQLQILGILTFSFQQIVFNKWKFSRWLKQGNVNERSTKTKTKRPYKNGRTEGLRFIGLIL